MAKCTCDWAMRPDGAHRKGCAFRMADNETVGAAMEVRVLDEWNRVRAGFDGHSSVPTRVAVRAIIAVLDALHPALQPAADATPATPTLPPALPPLDPADALLLQRVAQVGQELVMLLSSAGSLGTKAKLQALLFDVQWRLKHAGGAPAATTELPAPARLSFRRRALAEARRLSIEQIANDFGLTLPDGDTGIRRALRHAFDAGCAAEYRRASVEGIGDAIITADYPR